MHSTKKRGKNVLKASMSQRYNIWIDSIILTGNFLGG